MTEPEQWARELLDAVFDASDLGSACGIVDCPQCANAAISIQRAFEERERKLREAVIGMRKHADIFDGGKHQANRLAFDEFARAALGEKP